MANRETLGTGCINKLLFGLVVCGTGYLCVLIAITIVVTLNFGIICAFSTSLPTARTPTISSTI